MLVLGALLTILAGRRKLRGTSSSFSLAEMDDVEEETMVEEDDIRDRNLALFSMALF